MIADAIAERANLMYGYQCEYCEGIGQPRTVKCEAFKHRNGFVILEGVKIGICDHCDHRYYLAAILHDVHKLLIQKAW
jgi:hypothetical protein